MTDRHAEQFQAPGRKSTSRSVYAKLALCVAGGLIGAWAWATEGVGFKPAGIVPGFLVGSVAAFLIFVVGVALFRLGWRFFLRRLAEAARALKGQGP